LTVEIAGVFPALTTPYREDGSVGPELFAQNIARYNRTGLSGYVVLGSTGESVMRASSAHRRRSTRRGSRWCAT